MSGSMDYCNTGVGGYGGGNKVGAVLVLFILLVIIIASFGYGSC
ncbi:YjcZ family sporulation protein [Neobacillus mesonae]|nr:YjcZ family sporulation protein [Neobacillus mesonae]